MENWWVFLNLSFFQILVINVSSNAYFVCYDVIAFYVILCK